VARHNATWVFVEVRTRSSAAFGVPEESLTPRKRRHLITAAQYYLQAHALGEVNWRIDFVAVELSAQGAVKRIALIENAITAA
jgi:putative endonuclease